MMNERLPVIVYTPPQLVLQFQSQVLKKDKPTPGTTTSSTGSHEHFLYKLFTRSGNQRKSGDDSSEAQSLYDLGRIQCRMMATIETVTVEISMETDVWKRDEKWNNLIDPMQMQTATTLNTIQFQKNIEISSTNNVPTNDSTQQIRTDLKIYFLNGKYKNNPQFQQMNTNGTLNTIPKYFKAMKAYLKCYFANPYNAPPNPITTIIMPVITFQVSSNLRGESLHLMDHILECNATPTKITASNKAINRQPNSNFLCLFSGSQSIRNEKGYEVLDAVDAKLIITLLQQLDFVMS